MATLTKAALAERVYEFDNFETKVQAKNFVEDLLDIIKDEIIAGNEVSFAGFGKFEKFERTQDGKGTGTFKPKFAAFKDFKDAVNA